MIKVDKIIEFFCIIDNFCIEFGNAMSSHILPEQTDKNEEPVHLLYRTAK